MLYRIYAAPNRRTNHRTGYYLSTIGRLTLGREAQRLESLAGDLAQKGVSKVILDLSGVEYIDSSGIGIVMLSSGRLKQAGSRTVVVVPGGRFLQLLKMAGLDGLLTISDTVENATAAVAKKACRFERGILLFSPPFYRKGL